MTVEELQTFRRDVRDALQQVRAHGTTCLQCRLLLDNTLAHFLLMSRQHMALRAASALMCLSASTICTQVLGHQLLLCCGVTAYLLEHGLLSLPQQLHVPSSPYDGTCT